MMEVQSFREGMRVTDKYCFLNHASNGPLHDNVRETLHNVVDSQIEGNLNVSWDQVHDGFQVVREPIAKLMNCSKDEIALGSSTSYGIGLILESINWQNITNKKEIILDDLEFTSNSFAYQQLSKKFNLKLHVINNNKGDLDLSHYEKLLESGNINLVGISHVQFSNGFKSDLEKLYSLTQKNGSMLLVDAMQSVGALEINARLSADFIAVGSYKWCLGPFGTGFLYIKKNLQQDLDPIIVSSINDQNPLNFTHHEFNPHNDSRKFQSLFNPYFLGMGTSIELLNKVGIKIIEKSIYHLTDYLVEQVEKTPSLKIDSNREDQHKSGIVRILTTKNNVNLSIIVDKLLQKHNIVVSFRNEGIRVSPHFYNTFEEIDNFVNVLKLLLK